ncbi:voltage-gated ca2+ alpha subunit, putative [Ichthyophthirius multifiliis]|uniref:Voltage-gated ca2+ alpha subunit, putative n=1 Tax=Ichthyophthirius multifiliis TaxID=5932 RepID=G0QU32_ICHMU|nr:voltage-gated ca2+ alpha subunit, putative [Ichthyophthirius multifiliis]EGR31256.1 voltage-gated ca2+ alpha subunit, putative [Ichthyophthirius multifiliis]|eukprot:XP_004034742.1 voltage-gated ca2+ alpha subunit, putative [Ichthyophthirius multifiliis]
MFDWRILEYSINRCLNGCGSKVGYIYFVFFYLIFSMILVNLFIAVVLEVFEKIMYEENSHLKPGQIDDFIYQWQKIDKKATLFIQAEQIFELLNKVEQPLGWKDVKLNENQKKVIVGNLGISLYMHQYKQNTIKFYFYFYDVLLAITKKFIMDKIQNEDEKLESENKGHYVKQIMQNYKNKLKKNLKQKIITQYDSSYLVAVLIIKKALRKYRIRKQQLNLQSDTQENQDDFNLVNRKNAN